AQEVEGAAGEGDGRGVVDAVGVGRAGVVQGQRGATGHALGRDAGGRGGQRGDGAAGQAGGVEGQGGDVGPGQPVLEGDGVDGGTAGRDRGVVAALVVGADVRQGVERVLDVGDQGAGGRTPRD